MANVLSTAKRVAVISALCEGNSIRATVRMTGAAKNTIVKLLVELAGVCQRYADKNLRNLPCKRLQLDEIWAFCYSKQKNVPTDKQGVFGYGDVWTWVAIDADTKLVPSWLVGLAGRGVRYGSHSGSRKPPCQPYPAHHGRPQGVHLGGRGSFRRGRGLCPAPQDLRRRAERPGDRYSPAECTGCEKRAITGNPDEKHVSTSYVERQNLTMRMSIRRFTRLTNAFSKKVENHTAQVAVHFFHYNFCRPHMTLKGKTPVQAAGVDSNRWSIEDMVRLLPDAKD